MSDRRNVYPRGLDKAQSRVRSSYPSASISIESRRRPLIFDGSQLCSVQLVRCTRHASRRTFCASPHRGSGPLPFPSVSLRRDLSFSFSYFLFLFSFFLFSTSIGRRLVATATRRLLGFAFFILRLSAPLPARQRACSPAWQAAPACGNARDKCDATRSLRYSAGHPSITHVSSISFSSCLCALFASAQRTRLAESPSTLRLRRQKRRRVAPPPDRTLRADSFKYNSIGNNHDIPVPTSFASFSTMHRGRGGNLSVSSLFTRDFVSITGSSVEKIVRRKLYSVLCYLFVRIVAWQRFKQRSRCDV